MYSYGIWCGFARIPQIGDLLLVRSYEHDVYLPHNEYILGRKAILEFEFVRVKRQHDPADMFDATVRLKKIRANTEQELKEEQNSRAIYSALRDEGFYEPFAGWTSYARFGAYAGV